MARMQNLQDVMEEAQEMIKNLDEYVEIGNAFVALGDGVVEKFKPVVSKALKLLVELYADLQSELETELTRLSEQKAKSAFRDYKNYVKVGFITEEAFALVLASVKPVNFTDVLSNSLKNVSVKQQG